MKRLIQIGLAIFIAIFSLSSVSAQENTGITFSIMKKDGKLIKRDAQEQKVLDFYVIGLNSKEEVDAFIAKFKTNEHVVAITISYDFFAENRRVSSATFTNDATQIDIKNALLNSGVTQVVIKEKKIDINELLIEDADSNTETNTTN